MRMSRTVSATWTGDYPPKIRVVIGDFETVLEDEEATKLRNDLTYQIRHAFLSY